METSLLEDVIDKAVHEAVSHMSISEVRDMVIAPYLDIRRMNDN